MGRTLGIMFTATTYGTWLRGDQRGWVDEGRVLPADPQLQHADRRRMKHPPYTFPTDRLTDVGEAIVRALIDRMGITVLAATVQTWHAHVVTGATSHDMSAVVKCFKDAARYQLRPGRPIWADGYDKRFCFHAESLHGRVGYVERHNLRQGLAARPNDGITDIEEYLAQLAPGQ